MRAQRLNVFPLQNFDHDTPLDRIEKETGTQHPHDSPDLAWATLFPTQMEYRAFAKREPGQVRLVGDEPGCQTIQVRQVPHKH